MNRLALPLLVSLALAAPTTSMASEPPARPAPPTVTKRVWTSEAVEALRTKGLISLIGQQPPAEAPSTEAVSTELAVPRAPRPVRAKDPEWYAEQLGVYRAAMELSEAEIRLVRREIGNARYWEAGVNLVKENTGITPDSGLEILDGRNRLVLGKIDALGDQARRNGIAPGVLR